METEVQKEQCRRLKAKVGGTTPYHPKHLSLTAIKNSPQIETWLSQFSPQNRYAATRLLMRLEFVTRDDYSRWLRDALELLSPNEPCAIYGVRKFDEKCLWDDEGNVVNRPGVTLGSEDLVYSLIANLVRSNGTRFFDPPTLDILKNEKIHNIVLIDDSIGSGDRVTRFIKKMMAHKSFKSWWSFGFINIQIFAFARAFESEKMIITQIPGSNHGIRKHPASSKINFYSKIVYSKNCFFNRWGAQYQDIIDLCDSQTEIPKKDRRGYGECMSNIIFYHSVPNNIPGILFTGNKKKWKPLFPGRSFPKWLISLIENPPPFHGMAETTNSAKRYYELLLLPDDMLQMLSLIKSGVKRTLSLALRMDRDIEFLKAMLHNAQEFGLVSFNVNLTETGKKVLKRQTGGTDSRKKMHQNADYALYIPKSWCSDQVTVQPPALGENPWKQAYPAEVSSAGGEAGQVSLERSDARAEPLSVSSQEISSKSRKGSDTHGPVDPKDR